MAQTARNDPRMYFLWAASMSNIVSTQNTLIDRIITLKFIQKMKKTCRSTCHRKVAAIFYKSLSSNVNVNDNVMHTVDAWMGI